MRTAPVISSKDNPDNDPVIQGLAKRRSQISGEIEHLTGRVEKLRFDCANLDAVLAQFGVEVPEKAVRRMKSGTAGIFHPKELPRRTMEHLKANPEGLRAREIAMAIILDKGWNTEDERFADAVTEKVGRCLDRMRKQARVISEGPRFNTVWKRVT